MVMNRLWTFISCRVQLLHQQATTMWMYSGLSYPDRPFSEKLDNAEINAQIHKVLAHGADLNPGASHAPLGEGATAPG
jgi:hypothetical protein